MNKSPRGRATGSNPANRFERIANAEPDRWIPAYYVAFLNTLLAFNEKETSVVEQRLTKAQDFLDLAGTIVPDHAELLVAQALVHTAYIAHDPATHAMERSTMNAATETYGRTMRSCSSVSRLCRSRRRWTG